LENKPAFVKIIGFANKSILANLKFAKSAKYETEFLYRTISESHFLILPTRADCSPVTICEANSFGVPCLATNIGGIPTLIKPNLNGMLFNKDADINEYCQYIYRLFINYAKYKELALSSFDMYKSRLNWNIAGEKVRRLLAEVVA
jgi:glycosyltransferase involved in cell wall biosynthesis